MNIPPAPFPKFFGIPVFFFSLILLIHSNSVVAQELASQEKKSNIEKYFSVFDPNEEINSIHSGSAPDSLIIQKTKPKLLPANISFMEKTVWGEKGILRSIGLAPELSPEVRKSELGLRRFMLSAHQIGGFITLGLMIATSYYGQRVIDTGGHDINLDNTKKSLASFTILSYSLTGLLSVLSPPPLIRRDDENSTTTLHKTLAWVHVAGMIATPILASLIEKNRMFNSDAAHVHQIAGYLTTAVFALSMAVVTF